jgi:nitroreductase
MIDNESITAIIEKRFSCRIYLDRSIEQSLQAQLVDFMNSLKSGPFGSSLRFKLVAASEQDNRTLKGLGTYGFIRGARGFLLGVVRRGERDMEDFGYGMEQLILYATRLGLGTCWLGGTFNRSRFTKLIAPREDESMPAVASIGYIANPDQARGTLLRKQIDADRRYSWDRLFFDGAYGKPLERAGAGDFELPLEMLRWAPSASNKQPWRVIKDGEEVHLYLRRSPGYLDNSGARVMQIADLQRVDMGIAMCHFELTARENGLSGKWVVADPGKGPFEDNIEYTVSWVR